MSKGKWVYISWRKGKHPSKVKQTEINQPDFLWVNTNYVARNKLILVAAFGTTYNLQKCIEIDSKILGKIRMNSGLSINNLCKKFYRGAETQVENSGYLWIKACSLRSRISERRYFGNKNSKENIRKREQKVQFSQ